MEKNSFVQRALTVIFALVAIPTFAQTTNTASFTADCRSFKVNTISYVDEFLNSVNYYFTTYDGTTNYPSNIGFTTNGDSVLSGEFKPVTNAPGQYRASYLSTSTGDPGLFSFGTYVFNLASNSIDTNGLSTMTQVASAVSNSFTVTTTRFGPSTNFNSASNFPTVVSGTFVRDANSTLGTFSLVSSNSIVTSNSFTGTWQLLSLTGAISYVRDLTNTISLSLTNNTNSYTATTTFIVSNANVVVLPQFDIVSADGFTNTVKAGTTFKRTGNTYVANAIFLDGYAATSFPDYTNWVFQFTDNNDSNTNGVPDFSDVGVPAFFAGAFPYGGNVYYLTFTNGTPFGFYNLYNFPYFYHYDFGFAYFIDAKNEANGAFLYDFASNTFFYTEPNLWPYLYDFTLNSWLYYYPNPASPGSYSSGPRFFYDFRTSQIINK